MFLIYTLRMHKYLVIPECFCRGSRDFNAFKATRFPTEAFGNDENFTLSRPKDVLKNKIT